MKGQAFDTFKLMIAAVIAVAILGILLSILGGITTPTDPPTIIKERLSSAIRTPQSTVVSSSEANFQKGVIYQGTSFTDTVGGPQVSISFCCGSSFSGICTATYTGTTVPGTTCTATLDARAVTSGAAQGQVTINGDFKAKIYACCTPSANRCTVGIGAAPSLC